MKAMDAIWMNSTADSRPDSKYNAKELQMGIEVEHEHTACPIKATIIAKDHLDEIPDYYTRLKKMEDDAKGEVSDSKEEYWDDKISEAVDQIK